MRPRCQHLAAALCLVPALAAAGKDPRLCKDEGDPPRKLTLDTAPVTPFRTAPEAALAATVRRLARGLGASRLPSFTGEGGALVFPEPLTDSARAFAGAVADATRAHFVARDREHAAWDVELGLAIPGGTVPLRVVVARHGRPGEDGASLAGIEDARDGVVLVVAAGDGGPGLGAAPAGRGGDVEAGVTGSDAVLIGIGGSGGAPDPGGPVEVDEVAPTRRTAKVPGGGADPTGKDGSGGGHSWLFGKDCKPSQLVAFAGNGGNAPSIGPPGPNVHGGAGGFGGWAMARCNDLPCFHSCNIPPVAKACRALAVAGQAGHGASGRNRFALPGGGNGGAGGLGGYAFAKSCCGEVAIHGAVVLGDADAIGGSGGSGGQGGSTIPGNGGSGGNGGDGGRGWAHVCPGQVFIPSSTGRAVAGNGGNGGNGGNAGIASAGGAAGMKGLAAPAPSANAINDCDPHAIEITSGQSGVDGIKGKP